MSPTPAPLRHPMIRGAAQVTSQFPGQQAGRRAGLAPVRKKVRDRAVREDLRPPILISWSYAVTTSPPMPFTTAGALDYFTMNFTMTAQIWVPFADDWTFGWNGDVDMPFVGPGLVYGLAADPPVTATGPGVLDVTAVAGVPGWVTEPLPTGHIVPGAAGITVNAATWDTLIQPNPGPPDTNGVDYVGIFDHYGRLSSFFYNTDGIGWNATGPPVTTGTSAWGFIGFTDPATGVPLPGPTNAT